MPLRLGRMVARRRKFWRDEAYAILGRCVRRGRLATERKKAHSAGQERARESGARERTERPVGLLDKRNKHNSDHKPQKFNNHRWRLTHAVRAVELRSSLHTRTKKKEHTGETLHRARWPLEAVERGNNLNHTKTQKCKHVHTHSNTL